MIILEKREGVKSSIYAFSDGFLMAKTEAAASRATRNAPARDNGEGVAAGGVPAPPMRL